MSTKVNVERPSDNLAHAMAGAGGGLLSMALTFVQRTSKIRFKLTYTDTLLLHYPQELKLNHRVLILIFLMLLEVSYVVRECLAYIQA